VVPIGFELWAALEARRGSPDGLVFDRIPQSQAGRYYYLKKALRRLGLEGRLHTFRHSVALATYSRTTDIQACAQLLGHSPGTSMRYYLAARSLEKLRGLVGK
jgi:integrase